MCVGNRREQVPLRSGYGTGRAAPSGELGDEKSDFDWPLAKAWREAGPTLFCSSHNGGFVRFDVSCEAIRIENVVKG